MLHRTTYSSCFGYCLKAVLACLVLCLLLPSCKHHPIEPETEEPETLYPISMSASSSAMTTTRALVSDDATLQATTLGVFGYKQLSDGSKLLVFNNTEITYDNNTKGWTYTGTKYWDRTATYFFVSYSPYDASNTEYEVASNGLMINNIPNWQAIDANAKDFVVADDYGAADGHYITANGVKNVSLHFSHILTQLEVRVQKNPLLVNNYTLSEVKYNNVPQQSGSASYYCVPEGTLGGEAGDTPMNPISRTECTITNEAFTMATRNHAPITGEATESTTIKHLVAPFYNTSGDDDKDNIKITLGYSVNGIDQTPVEVNTGISELQANQRYVLTLTFNSGADVTASVQIEPWKDEPVDEDPKYNW